MNPIRLRIAAVLLWLFGLYNIERLHEPINIASFTYVYVAGIALANLFLPWMQTHSLPRIAAPTCIAFLVIKWLAGYDLAGGALPLTITELCVVCITLVLGRDIARALSRVEDAVSDAMIERVQAHAVPFSVGQAAIYREIRRARSYGRPLSLVAVASPNGAVRAQMHRLIEDIQRENASHYVSAKIAELIGQETKDCDIVTQRDDHFVVGLPEVTKEDAETLAHHLADRIEERLGFKVGVGAASFPDEEVTFDLLLERAERAMRAPNGKLHRDDPPSPAAPTAEASPVMATNGARGRYVSRSI